MITDGTPAKKAIKNAAKNGNDRDRGLQLAVLTRPPLPPVRRCVYRSTITAARVGAAPDGVREPTRAPSTWRSRLSPRSWSDELDDLAERRRAERLALRQQPAARVDRAARRRARSRRRRAGAPARPARTGRAPGTRAARGPRRCPGTRRRRGRRARCPPLRTRRAPRASTAA